MGSCLGLCTKGLRVTSLGWYMHVDMLCSQADDLPGPVLGPCLPTAPTRSQATGNIHGQPKTVIWTATLVQRQLSLKITGMSNCAAQSLRRCCCCFFKELILHLLFKSCTVSLDILSSCHMITSEHQPTSFYCAGSSSVKLLSKDVILIITTPPHCYSRENRQHDTP